MKNLSLLVVALFTVLVSFVNTNLTLVNAQKIDKDSFEYSIDEFGYSKKSEGDYKKDFTMDVENSLNELSPAVGVLLIIVGFVLVAFSIFIVVFQFWMIYDIATKQEEDKALWLLITLLTSPIGAIIYYFFIRSKRNNKEVTQN